MIKVGVVRGGPSSEYEVSLNTGGNVLSHLRSDELNTKYKTVDIFIDKKGLWHIDGVPTNLERIFYSVDVIFNALHGDYGEDGKIQQIFEKWKIPYTGSGPFTSALGYNKALAKERFSMLGIKTPQHILFPLYQEDFDGPKNKYSLKKAREVLGRMSPPWIVKPLAGGSSVGIRICKTFPELVRAFEDLVKEKVSVIVEEFIEGKEASVGVIENFRNKKIYTLPPTEICIPKEVLFFDYDAKYNGKLQKICPGNFTKKEKEKLEQLASFIHTGFNLDHYSRSDFIIHPKRGIYTLEVNTLPGLTSESLTPKALQAVGATMPEFIEHIIKLAQNRYK